MRVALCLVVVVLAGCLSDGSPGASDPVKDPQWALAALPDAVREPGHDHLDPAHHRGRSTPNFQVIGHDPLPIAHHGRPAGDYNCGDARTDGERTLAVFGSYQTDLALGVLDVTDPMAPVVIGEYILPFVNTWHAALTPDMRYGIVATATHDTEQDGPLPVTVATCAGTKTFAPADALPLMRGVVLVDLSDPTDPQFADYRPVPTLGAHSVWTGEIDGITYVVASSLAPNMDTSSFHIYTIDEGLLVPQTVVPVAIARGTTGAGPSAHTDAMLAKHPVTGRLLLHVAAWDAGYLIIEMDGARTRLIGQWNDLDPAAGEQMTGKIHQATAIGMVGDRHLTIVGQEIVSQPAGRPTGQVILMDTTDPTTPMPVARWTLPVEVEWDGFIVFSTHYAILVGEVLFVSMYHGGLWAVDAREAVWPELPSLGAFIPDGQSEAPVAIWYAPSVDDVDLLPGGELLVFDSYSGAYTVRFDATVEVPAAAPWTQDAWIAS